MSVKVLVSVSRDRAERDVQLGVISIQMVFEGIFFRSLSQEE